MNFFTKRNPRVGKLKIRPAKGFWGYLVLPWLFGLAAGSYDLRAAVCFGAVWLIVPLVGLLLTQLVVSLTFSVTQSAEILEKGDVATFALVAENNRHLQLCDDEKRVYTAGLAGKHIVSVDAVCGHDPLGIFRFKMTFRKPYIAVFVVLPNATAASKQKLTDGQTPQALNTSGDPSAEHRPYLPGDPLRRVNWKQFARSRELTVRAEEDNRPPVVLTLDPDPPSAIVHDQNMESILAEVAAIAGRTCLVRIRTDGDWREVSAANREELRLNLALGDAGDATSFFLQKKEAKKTMIKI